MNTLSIITVRNQWRPEVYYSTFAIDGVAINEWLAQYTDIQLSDEQHNDPHEFSDRCLAIALDLYDHIDTETVWQYLGLPENRSVTYVPILTCPDDMDLHCIVRVVEQRYDTELVHWERFGTLLGYVDAQDPKEIDWFANIPKLVFSRDNFIEVFSELNTDIMSKNHSSDGRLPNIPFPAKPIKEEWEKILDHWFPS